MNQEKVAKLEEASTTELTERLSRLSLETHTIGRILSERDATARSTHSTSRVKRKHTIHRNRINCNGLGLRTGDRVRVLTKGKIKLSESTVVGHGPLIVVEGNDGTRIKRKSTNLAKIE